MNRLSKEAALAELWGLLRVIFLDHFLDVPKRDGAIFHTTSDDTELIDLVDPVKSHELRGRDRGSSQT